MPTPDPRCRSRPQRGRCWCPDSDGQLRWSRPGSHRLPEVRRPSLGCRPNDRATARCGDGAVAPHGNVVPNSACPGHPTGAVSRTPSRSTARRTSSGVLHERATEAPTGLLRLILGRGEVAQFGRLAALVVGRIPRARRLDDESSAEESPRAIGRLSRRKSSRPTGLDSSGSAVERLSMTTNRNVFEWVCPVTKPNW